MPGAFIPTVPIVPGSDYYEEAKEGFERRIREPGEVFREKLQQGTTGPAPALTLGDTGNVRLESPEGFGEVNDSIIKGFTGDRDAFDRLNRQSAGGGVGIREFVGRIVGVLAVLAVGLVVLNAFLTGVGEGLGQRVTGADDV